MQVVKFSLLEWRDRRYRHVKYVTGTRSEAKRLAEKLNEGYSGPRFVLKEVAR